MNIVAISGSPRESGNTDIVMRKVLEGMKRDDLEIIKVNDLNI